MKVDKEIRSIRKLIFLHLFPGIILSIVYIFFSKMGILAGYPKVVILGLSVIFSTIPIELGYLFYVAKKEEETLNIFKILGLKGKLKVSAFILYSLSLIIVGGILLIALKPLSNHLLETIFCWIPSWYNFVQDMSLFSKNYIIIAILVSFFILTLIAPITEELYFRGFLLARMKWMGGYSVLFNVTLFSIYHFCQPWLIIARIAAMLPLYYCVYKKDSLKLGIVVHCLGNFTDVVSYMTLLI
ncbi:CPBP family intramembrane glutamic endopeptidase [Clostridium sp. SM-530-WT-3G]|uniref:CPBP family intramembrane glutamic endopeptidase n=1 Tax=Clostridium sp. SM-530-WT-3G TaxID=2725303 RepID=UPI00145E5800|nr:CPBP family intramembrane glutamic endopeptidase [Clostridium sp. SM-530-WT-3G]NME84188.1 CPBP family intramembrane metalloprotease [Clostridium sp. SM-530-WT-3G]